VQQSSIHVHSIDMSMRVQTMRASTMRATRVTIPRSNFPKAPIRASRPATLQTEFLSAGAALKGLCASFAGTWAALCCCGIVTVEMVLTFNVVCCCRDGDVSFEKAFSRKPWNFGCGGQQQEGIGKHNLWNQT
jgi:hypothetical protein